MKLDSKELSVFAFWDTFTWGAAEQLHVPGLSAFDPVAAQRFAWKFLVSFVMTWCNPGYVICIHWQNCYRKRTLNIVLPRRKSIEYIKNGKRGLFLVFWHFSLRIVFYWPGTLVLTLLIDLAL